MARPLIGITTYPPDEDDRYTLPVLYVSAVRRAGGEAVLLPPGTDVDPADLDAVLGRLDGVVLAGGGDLDPALYGGSSHETVYAIHPGRDRDELALARRLLDDEVPTLAICRGSQVVNVALGGTLETHLPERTRLLHRIEPPVLRAMPAPTPHEVTLEADSRLAQILGATTVTPMSWHHQAIDRPGDGLRVVARAPDGTVEATEHPDHPHLVCVQWHPELTAAEDGTQQRLFDVLVEMSALVEGRST